MAEAGADYDIADMLQDTDHPSLPVMIRIFTQNDLKMNAVEEQFDLSRCEEILRGYGRALHDL